MTRKPTLTGLAGLLEHDSVRRLHDADDVWHYSILDTLALLADTDHPAEYWADLQRAGRAVGQQFGEADDRGERRAQLVGDVVDEIVAQLFRVDERLVALGQRAFHRDGGGRVGEGQ